MEDEDIENLSPEEFHQRYDDAKDTLDQANRRWSVLRNNRPADQPAGQEEKNAAQESKEAEKAYRALEAERRRRINASKDPGT